MVDWLALLVAFLAVLLRIIVIPCKSRETHEEIWGVIIATPIRKKNIFSPSDHIIAATREEL
jgi:hypothetical protein